MTAYNGRVMVLGANGETGHRVLRSLQDKSISARAIVRSTDKIQSLKAPATEVFIGNVLDENDLAGALKDVKAIICTLGTRTFTDLKAIEEVEYTAIITLIAAAQKAGIAHFVLCSSMGTSNPESIPPLANILQAKHRAEEALRESGLIYTIVHPGGLLNESGGNGVLVQPHPGSQNGSISRDDAAEVLVQALLQPEARNKSVDIISQNKLSPANRPGLFQL